MIVSMDRQYKTVCDFPVRILCNDAMTAYSVVGLVRYGDYEILMSWTLGGQSSNGDRKLNLVELPEKKEKPPVQEYCPDWNSFEDVKHGCEEGTVLLVRIRYGERAVFEIDPYFRPDLPERHRAATSVEYAILQIPESAP